MSGLAGFPAVVEAEMPFRGECGLCGGPDARHRVVDAIASRVRAGDSIEMVADDYGMTTNAIALIVEQWVADDPDGDDGYWSDPSAAQRAAMDELAALTADMGLYESTQQED